ncbi:DUF4296 domain-containing protein [Cyclobacterium jeungdonense]|uniref:DUF4296 domain-containing protein n=1 Tax=Cyclobacterium jeungdonense TaxID=708087 RepID=A0ABT8C1Y7_9BACT|nr:DUF4296 domain-containing protein [Cyclobacterium jeungdonense]MDN3686756.1 DUF4296 domain-containing protein [Cyclobacterium jeungdonense]
MKLTYSVFALFILLVSCDGKEKPEELLSEDKMVEILVDIHLAEGFVQSLSIPYDSTKVLYPILEKQIFEKHGIADTVYINSLEHYLLDASKMEYLYERTIDSLTLREKIAR